MYCNGYYNNIKKKIAHSCMYIVLLVGLFLFIYKKSPAADNNLVTVLMPTCFGSSFVTENILFFLVIFQRPDQMLVYLSVVSLMFFTWCSAQDRSNNDFQMEHLKLIKLQMSKCLHQVHCLL